VKIEFDYYTELLYLNYSELFGVDGEYRKRSFCGLQDRYLYLMSSITKVDSVNLLRLA